MNFDGAENAKAEVFRKAFRYAETGHGVDGASATDAVSLQAGASAVPTFAPQFGTEAHDEIRRARRERGFHPKEKIAVGILRYGPDHQTASNLKVGLFRQHGKLRHHPVVEAAQRITRNEIEIIVTGRARCQGAPAVKP